MNGVDYACQATSEKYTGIPYSKLDCQAFVEEVLKDCNVRKPEGSVYNWAGSNSMWRTALSWKGTVAECRERYGEIPLGAWVFIVKRDGKEKDRGYYDNEGNATHVGIYCRQGPEPVRDSTKTSTRNGVGYRTLTGFTHVGLPKMIDYSGANTPDVIHAVHLLRDHNTSDADYLNAMVTLLKYIEGV